MSDGPSRTIGRVALGLALVGAGIGHLTFAREEFRAQVPSWVPIGADAVVLGSGVVEIALGATLLLAPRRFRPVVGVVAAAFLVAVFPGNIAQWREHADAFGLDTDAERFGRLLVQPVLVALALWSTGGWGWLRRLRR